ncbi:hypothetical protein FJ208_01295 [Candidatus Gribaldobacteria bacterium]|nr:hypothetical protein [Candidatus Gribaldobacteria bacterium]
MSFQNWAKSKIQKMDWLDMQIVKVASMAFALLLAKIYPPILGLSWYWYFLIFVLLALVVFSRILPRK